jgi:hypothetical protein
MVNAIELDADEGWFVMFRLYGPKLEHYDKSWKPPDFERIK